MYWVSVCVTHDVTSDPSTEYELQFPEVIHYPLQFYLPICVTHWDILAIAILAYLANSNYNFSKVFKLQWINSISCLFFLRNIINIFDVLTIASLSRNLAIKNFNHLFYVVNPSKYMD